jgi:hypothetical protein
VRVAYGQSGEAGRGGEVDVRSRSHPEQRERGSLPVGEMTQGPGQDSGQAGGGIVGVQRVQAELSQVRHDVVEEVGVRPDAGGDQADREWEPAAQGDQLGDPRGSDAAVGVVQRRLDDGACFDVGQHVDVDGLGAVPGEQRGEPVSAGHQNGAAGTAG